MNTTPAKKHSCRRRSVLLSRAQCRALRRRGQQSLRYWKFITHRFTSQRRRHSRSLFAFFKRMRTALGALAFAFWLPTVAQAETFTVTTASDISAEDDGQLTLREAIHSANETPGPDTIDFVEELSGQVLTLAQGELVVTDDLAIDASSLAEAPIIDADQKSRVINVTAPEGDLELTHLTLRNGKATEDDSEKAEGGGILFDSSGELSLTASTVSGCAALGGYYADGGGIHTTSGAITITNSTLSGNSVAGGPYAYGGGISSSSGEIVIINSTLNGNSATSYYRASGGGIASSGAITLVGSTLSGNSAIGSYKYGGGHGGGINAVMGAVTLSNSTIIGNIALGYYSSGGGILARSGPCILANSIIAGNFIEKSALGLESIASDLDAPFDPANHLEVSHCLIGNSTGARLEDAKVNLNNLTDVDPLLEPLADNGGPTQTHALDPRSPAIDQGNANGPDQRGFPRIDNPIVSNAAGGNGSDIGAFERSAAILVSDPGDVTDGDYSAGNCTLREAIDVANADPVINEIGFLDSLSGQVIRLTQGELVVTDDLLIDGSGIEIAPVIDADQQSRGIHFTAPTGDLELNQLTLRNGQTSGPNEPGGGILFSSSGNLTISRSTFGGNSTTGSNSPGGGVYSESGSLTLSNSTFSGNSTSGIGSHGGGVASGTASVTLASCTIAENLASGAGGGIHGGNGKFTLLNTLIANNADDGTAPDLSAPENPAINLELSHSLIGNSTGAGLDEAQVNQSNIIDVDPLLEPLGDNGGPTLTHTLAAGSPAIDQANATATGTDQRGFPRMDDRSITNAGEGNGSDIGAFERTANLVVDLLGDVTDGDLTEGNCTLREAIEFANDRPEIHEVFFSEDLSGEVITLIQGELVITDDLAIDASGLAEAPIIDADQKSRVINVTAPEGNLELTKLTLRNGRVTEYDYGDSNGGGILFGSNGKLTLTASTLSGCSAEGTFYSYARGGGIHTISGVINLTYSTLSGNSTVSGFKSSGGGIYSHSGSVTVTNSTINKNFTTGPYNPNDLYSHGGGIYSSSGAVTLTSSTLSGNVATATYRRQRPCDGFHHCNYRVGSSIERGGAVATGSGAITITSTTIRGNAADFGGGVSSTSGALTITNSIVAGNSGSSNTTDLDSPEDPANLLEVSQSLIGSSSGARLGEAKVNLNNLTDIDPMLAPLADNGGPTWTMLPFPGSPVINAGATADHTTDQRGFGHIGTPDIGAVEYQGSSDLSRVFGTDFDHDGNAYGVEQALGTDPFLADPNSSRNLLAPTFNLDGHPVLSFGIADDAAPGTLWILERTTDLVAFDEIYRFDGSTHFDFEGSPIDIETTASGVIITDQAPPAGGVFYRMKITFEARE